MNRHCLYIINSANLDCASANLSPLGTSEVIHWTDSESHQAMGLNFLFRSHMMPCKPDMQPGHMGSFFMRSAIVPCSPPRGSGSGRTSVTQSWALKIQPSLFHMPTAIRNPSVSCLFWLLLQLVSPLNRSCACEECQAGPQNCRSFSLFCRLLPS